MSWTQTDIDALKAAIAQGTISVRYGDREVRYRSLDEMRQTLAMMREDVEDASGRRRTRQVRFQTGKGL